MSTTVPISQCPTTAVTVFSDRAEVTRKVEVNGKGHTEIVITGLPPTLNANSVRVNGLENTPILDVITTLITEKPVMKEEETQLQLKRDERETLLVKSSVLAVRYIICAFH